MKHDTSSAIADAALWTIGWGITAFPELEVTTFVRPVFTAS